MDLDARLRGVLASVFGVDGATLPDDASPRTIEEWDSVSHIQLVFALEAEFDVRFEPEEIAELTSLAAIHQRIALGDGRHG